MLKFIDLNTQYQRLRADINQRLERVLSHGQYILGPEVYELEQQLVDYVGVKHCITVASGTDALLLALMALGIGPGDEVIVPAFTFIAPAEMVALLGAKPVLVDIDAKTYNLNANLLEAAITTKTKAIIPVNLFGQCADFDAIKAIASQHKLAVIEDAAQSLGAVYRGKRSGGLATISCTSFFPSKPLGCYGDGGACFTNDDGLAAKIRCISNHGQQGKYDHVMLGINSRLDTMQAAILLAKLKIFPGELERRLELAELYNELLKGYVTIPNVDEENRSVYAQYTIASGERAKVQAKLQQENIPSAIHYPKSLHIQDIFKSLPEQLGDFLYASTAAQQVISLPFSPYLEPKDIERVALAVIMALEG